MIDTLSETASAPPSQKSFWTSTTSNALFLFTRSSSPLERVSYVVRAIAPKGQLSSASLQVSVPSEGTGFNMIRVPAATSISNTVGQSSAQRPQPMQEFLSTLAFIRFLSSVCHRTGNFSFRPHFSTVLSRWGNWRVYEYRNSCAIGKVIKSVPSTLFRTYCYQFLRRVFLKTIIQIQIHL